MPKNNGSRTLVIFNKRLPKLTFSFWESVDLVIAPKVLEKGVCSVSDAKFINISELIDAGSVHEASKLTRNLSDLTFANGEKISKSAIFDGYELWWIHYNDFMHSFCLPFTQYKRLLERIREGRETFLYEPPHLELFQYYLSFYNHHFHILSKVKGKLPSVGILIQILLSLVSIPFLALSRPKFLVWTSDLFDGKNDFDFRMKYIYLELRSRKIKFLEFIRSLEPVKEVVSHAVVRLRPVIYSHAIINLAHILAHRFNHEIKDLGEQKDFWALVSVHYLRNLKGSIWSIRILRLIIRLVGIKAAIIDAASSRTLHEIIACKTLGISVVGIQHGASIKNYNVSDYMPGFSGAKSLGVDRYGVWSEWWKEYHLENSSVYNANSLAVSGPMRPFTDLDIKVNKVSRGGKVKVLFISEQLAWPTEVMPFLEKLLADHRLEVYLKVRVYHDGFEQWLRANRPEIVEKIGEENIVRTSMHEALARADIVVGSHSTGVLESLLTLKPFVFFHTNKWGDYFELKSLKTPYNFYAESPEELVQYILDNININKEALVDLKEKFFGRKGLNGSKWVVEESLNLL